MRRKAQHCLQTNLLIIILRWKRMRDPLVTERAIGSVIFLEDNLGSHPLILYLNKEKIASLLQPF